jgi:hypothetical protein
VSPRSRAATISRAIWRSSPDLLLLDPLGGLLGSEPLEGHPDIAELEDLCPGHERHPHRPVGPHLKGAFGDEPANRLGAAFVGEFYADLDYGPDGFLIITREHHAVEPAEAAARVLRAMNEGKVRATNGEDFSVRAQSVCVHSDTPGALAVAKAVHEALRPARAAE